MQCHSTPEVCKYLHPISYDQYRRTAEDAISFAKTTGFKLPIHHDFLERIQQPKKFSKFTQAIESANLFLIATEVGHMLGNFGPDVFRDMLAITSTGPAVSMMTLDDNYKAASSVSLAMTGVQVILFHSPPYTHTWGIVVNNDKKYILVLNSTKYYDSNLDSVLMDVKRFKPDYYIRSAIDFGESYLQDGDYFCSTWMLMLTSYICTNNTADPSDLLRLFYEKCNSKYFLRLYLQYVSTVLIQPTFNKYKEPKYVNAGHSCAGPIVCQIYIIQTKILDQLEGFPEHGAMMEIANKYMSKLYTLKHELRTYTRPIIEAAQMSLAAMILEDFKKWENADWLVLKDWERVALFEALCKGPEDIARGFTR
jgi:hypothetical protein